MNFAGCERSRSKRAAPKSTITLNHNNHKNSTNSKTIININIMTMLKEKRRSSGRKDATTSSDFTSPLSSTPICYPCQPAKPTQSKKNSSAMKKQQCSSLPKMVSVGTAATVTSSRSMYSSTTSHASSSITPTTISSKSSSKSKLCPVTGLYANIKNDYYILPKVLGKGHYGIVRECMHRTTRQVLAVKSIEKCNIGRLDHLQREIYLLANIDHEHIMKMVDCYEDAECVHIITEKYTGGELFDTILDNVSSNGCLSERKTINIIKSLLEAVAYLHDQGIVHRDIKPENLLFETSEEDASIKLIDFGLSRRHEEGETPMSNPVGTAYYMSPELLKGKYDRSCDLWAVGVVTYILLCGFPPYNGSSDEIIQKTIRKGKLTFSGNWLYKSDQAIDFVKCLLRRDQKRYTAKEALAHPWIRHTAE